MRTLATLGLLAALAGPAIAAGSQDLGVREKEVVDEALALRALTIDPQPQGKVIGTVHVVNLEVFTNRDLAFSILDQDLSLAIFNRFHWTTREEMIRREALFRPGQVYNQDLIAETTRALTNQNYTSALGIVPVKAAAPGAVDILIATRDIWSLRLNTNFEYQAGTLLYLTASLAENNLFGHRKLLALVTELDQGRLAAGPTYIDPNIRGTRLTATVEARLHWARATGDLEGSSSHLALAYPLYSLDSRWGAGIDYSHSDAVVRVFEGTRLRPEWFVDPNDPTMTPEARDYIYRLRQVGGAANVVRRFRRPSVVQDVSLGHLFGWAEPSLLPGFPPDHPVVPLDPSLPRLDGLQGPPRIGEHYRAAELARHRPTISQQFKDDLFPPSGYVSALQLSYALFAPRYRIYRDLNSFDLRENAQLGPSATVTLRRADHLLGTDAARQYWLVSVGGAWAFDLADGYQKVSLGWAGRHYDREGRWFDQTFSGGVYAATPVIKRAIRVVGSLAASLTIDDNLNSVATLGGSSGLRGYAIGEFFGRSYFIGHLEVRSMAVPVLFTRAGVLAFYDVGDAATPPTGDGNNIQRAWATLRGLRAYQDVGMGLRVLIPQANTVVLRADWAFPLQDDTVPSPVQTKAGWPGRFSAGFEQVF